jgi:hypothetical protein
MESSFKITSRGCTWTDFLPKGNGEPCATRHMTEEKLRRAEKRKNVAQRSLARQHQRRMKGQSKVFLTAN